MTVFKYGSSGVYPRIHLRIPYTAPSDPVYRLLRRLVLSAGSSTGWLLPGWGPFPVSAVTFNRSIKSLLRGTPAPLGSRYTPRSLRSGGMSAAYAVGVPIPVIMRLSHQSDAKVVQKHYLDALTRPCAAARLFFSRFTSLLRAAPGTQSRAVGTTGAEQSD